MSIGINIDRAKALAHDLRRRARDKDFAPLDRKVTIPTEAAAAEAQRQQVREKYAQVQQEIDSAQSVEDLSAALVAAGVIK